MAYSYQGSLEKTAKAFARDENISWKDCNEVCYAIRGKKIENAIKYLERTLNREDFIPFRRYAKGKGHRERGRQGGWPIKSVKLIMSLLKNARANGESRGLDMGKTVVVHATAYKTRTLHRIKPKHGTDTHDIDLATVEIIIKEV